EQAYVQNTAVLRTVLHDAHGGSVEVTDFMPRWRQYGRIYRPAMLVRRLRPLSGRQRVRVLLPPLAACGADVPESTWGSNHIRHLLPAFTLRLTSDIPVRMVREGLAFELDGDRHLVLGPDETLTDSVRGFVRNAERLTLEYWREWSRYLSIPLEWQDAGIRSAITLKLCQYEQTGAIVAAITTSNPESPGRERFWGNSDGWLRGSAFAVRALNRLGAAQTMQGYLRYVLNLATGEEGLQPLYGIAFESRLEEH